MNADAYVELGWYFKFEEFDERVVDGEGDVAKAKTRHRFRVILVSPNGDQYYTGVGNNYDEAAAYALQRANDERQKLTEAEANKLDNLTR
jgi:flavin-binding protein dodecin